MYHLDCQKTEFGSVEEMKAHSCQNCQILQLDRKVIFTSRDNNFHVAR